MTDLSLLKDFIPEAIEHLEDMEANLLRLESNPSDTKVLQNIFRAAHTIKGSAEYLGMNKISLISHKLENLLEIIRHGEKKPDSSILETLIESRDKMSVLVGELQHYEEERADIEALVSKIDALTRRMEEDTEPEGDDLLGIGDELEPQDGDDDFLGGGDGPEILDGEKDLAGDGNEKWEANVFDDDFLSEEDESPDTPDQELESQKKQASLVDDSSRDVGSKATAALSDEESYEEEYDDELFQIFLDHLEDNFAKLKTLAGQVRNSGDPDVELAGCLDAVASMRSSAAYMDYRTLTEYYDAWAGQIKEVQDGLSAGFRQSFLFLDEYMAQVVTRFSQFRQLLKLAADEQTGPEKIAAEPADDPKPSSPQDQLAADAEEPSRETGAEQSAPAPVESSKGLFDELDDVFDASADSEPKTDFDPFSEDVEEELSERKAAEPPQESGEPVKDAVALPDPEPETRQATPLASKKPAAVKVEAGTGAKLPPGDNRQVPESEAPTETPLAPKKPARPAEPSPQGLSAPASLPEPKTDQTPKIKKQTGTMELDAAASEATVKQTLRVDASKIDKLMNQVGELVVSRASYAQLHNDMREFQQRLSRLGLDALEMKYVRDLTFRLSEATVALGRVANDLQEDVMKVRMLPIAQLFNRYPRLVRDLVHDTDKKVHLELRGEETELDKMVIEELADPLVHIIRNAVDHGIEPALERRRKGKPETATLRLESFHESNHVVVEITDDGKGIDPEKIKKSALEKGLHTEEELEHMRGNELLAIIMTPGFSTSKEVTTTSGRGVGMDVVKKNIEKLNGTVEVDSKATAGTRIRIKIPLTLAIIQALLVKVGGEVFTIPLSVVEETLRVREDEISSIEGVEVIQLRDGVLSLLRLTSEFGKVSSAPDPEQAYVVVVNTGMRQVGLVVDSLIGQEEAVIKPLVDYLQEKSGFSGATILGDGSVSLILDVYELVALIMAKQAGKRQESDYDWAVAQATDQGSFSEPDSDTFH